MTIQSDGGKARAEKLSPQRRTEISRAAARARWKSQQSTKIPYQRPLGYYKVWLKPGSQLADLYGMAVITARMIERSQKNGTHRFLDLPRPGHGVDKIELVTEN